MQNQEKTGKPLWTILKTLIWTTSFFKSHHIETPRVDAEILLAHILQTERIDLYVRYDQPLCKEELGAFKSLILRRARREPVAYIVGKKGFWSLDLSVSDAVLIPRPETECLVEAAISILDEDRNTAPKRLLELGTGSGAIILSLASEQPDHLFFASDRSSEAAHLAQKNAADHGLGTSVRFFSGDWFAPLRKASAAFDMILSNPPYIRSADIPQLQPEICGYEPALALDGGKDGLVSVRHIIRKVHAHLTPGGYLLLEIGHDQKNGVLKIIDDCAYYEPPVFMKDYSGHDRVVQIRKKLL
ncbi:MAG: protein-(glutamine-N5) methyltransferase, release factor-specific [Desulfobacteraceae bacterium 4572_88]|nr:MAG: protein-(glutamine-N5) methyltransferase, release factor-specific [Desulfobacteraceae bacterium 4572_88]